MTQFKIESNVPLPEDLRKSRRKYPFNEMKPGQSFKFHDKNGVVKNRIQAAIAWYKKKHPKQKFTVRKIDDSHGAYRVWRVE